MVNLTMIYDPARNEVVLLIRKVQQESVKESERGNQPVTDNCWMPDYLALPCDGSAPVAVFRSRCKRLATSAPGA